MKNFQLLESIGSVDEELLEQAENARYTRRSPVFKVLLVAAIVAMLSVSVVAAQSLFADVDDGDVVEKVFTITTVDSDFVLGEGERQHQYRGYTICADIETAKDVPMKLLYPYLPDVPEDWKCIGAAHAKYDGEYGVVGITWEFERNGEMYEVFYRQESAYFYNTSEDRHVWDITHVPEDMTVSGRVEMLGDAKVYRVFLSGTNAKNTIYQPYSQSLIVWSDGYSIFLLQVPEVMSDEEIFTLMCSLKLCTSDLHYALSHLND